MADNIIQLPADSTGSKLDTESLTVGANTVHRQRVELADTTTAAGLARVTNAAPTSEYGLVTRPLRTDTVATGTISATDAVVAAPGGAGALVSGASTANSLVFVVCPGGDASWQVQLTGTFGSGTYYFEGSLDSTTGTDGNWISLTGVRLGILNTTVASSATAAGIYEGVTGGLKYFRVRVVGATSPSCAVVIRVSAGPGLITLNSALPTGTNSIGAVTQATGTNLHAVIDSGSTTAATQATGTNLHAVIDSGSTTAVTGTVTTQAARAATSAQTSVASSASVVTILASNANRLGATVFNDSTVLLYLHMGASASTTVHAIQMQASGYYEVPSGYTGILTGLWTSATGNARVVELTA